MGAKRIPDEIRAERIRNYLLIERTCLRVADVGLIFGNRTICNQLAERAAVMYRQGYFKHIIVTGGVPARGGKTESQAIRARLLSLGVPDSAILFETSSTNSQQNIENARALLAQRPEIGPVRSVIGIGHIKAGRRFLMTLRQHWPEVQAMHVSVNPYGVPVRDWTLSRRFREAVLAEWDKIPAYFARGYIHEIDLDRLNRNVRYFLVRDPATRPHGPRPAAKP